jgi:UTP:GlnB (protein PII) uridylyltransferase
LLLVLLSQHCCGLLVANANWAALSWLQGLPVALTASGGQGRQHLLPCMALLLLLLLLGPVCRYRYQQWQHLLLCWHQQQ